MSIKFNPPARPNAFDKQAHDGHLLLFIGIGRRSGETKYGSDTWAHCRWVVDLDTGDVAEDVSVFGKVLAPSIYDASDPVVGRLMRGVAKKDQFPPWLLDPATDDDLDVADQWADRFLIELPDGELSIQSSVTEEL